VKQRINVKIDTTSRKILLGMAIFAVIVVLWHLGKSGLANMAALRTDRTDIADLTIDWAPADPQTHFAAAVLYDKTFLPQDQTRSLSEYETAVALSPDNYLLWLEYGKALSRSGDSEHAEAALRRAVDLAPNYAIVHWTLGNTLVRNGKADEGFAEIGKAIEADESYARPAVAIAYTYFDRDAAKIRGVVGPSAAADAALALALASDKRYSDAVLVWSSIGTAKSSDQLTEARNDLVNDLLSAKNFTLARQVSLSTDTPPVGEITNGGFEEGIKLQNAALFEWQITVGSQPQIAQSTRQPHSGGRSLVLIFNSTDGNSLRQMSQTVVVQPGGKYTFRGFYHSDLKSTSPLVWQVVNASSGQTLAELPLKDPVNDWTQFAMQFPVPQDTDGVTFRLLRAGCGSTICPITGSMWFDDLSLAQN